MTFLKRLKWFSATLAVAGVITSATVWGDASRKPTTLPAPKSGKLFSESLIGKFTNRPIVTYQNLDGQTFFALQVKPELAAVPVRPRDIAILVDASASQAGTPLEAARQLAREVIGTANESDRISVWTVSTPKATRNLVRGGGMKNPTEAKSALVALDAEYASGAIDFKGTLERVAKEFDGKATRQQVILYIGDGESALNPMDEKTRYSLAEELRSQQITFYAVPLGIPTNAHNLHSMVSGTGGLVVRMGDEAAADQASLVKSTATRFQQALAVPVLHGAKATFAQAPAEVFPATLPPLRADVPTLVVGSFEKGKAPKEIAVTLDGKVYGQPVNTQVKQPMPSTMPDNFFLNSMVSQWRDSGRVDAPAMLRADRTLAMAFETTRLAREEFLEQADWALGVKKFDIAKSLYEAASKLDPEDPRTKSGLKLSQKLEKGEVSLEDIRKATFKNSKGENRVNVNQLVQAKEAPQAEPKADPKAPLAVPAAPADIAPPKANQLLEQEEAKQKIREQQTNVAVDETLSRARNLLTSGDPKSAKDLLVAQRDTLRVTSDLSEATRQKLLNRIDLLLTDVGTRGDAIVRARAEENERIARARQRLLVADQTVAREERIRERIRNFTTLMNQARYEDAYREALVMENEQVNEARPVPVETQAVARIGQAASNYRDFRELVRLREDRYLLSMMEVEKSHMPYPDEPAVHFPPAKVWRELTSRRREFASADFDKDFTPRQKQRFSILQSAMTQTLDLSELSAAGEFQLKTMLSTLQDLITAKMKTDVKLYVNYNAFPDIKGAQDIMNEQKVNLSALKSVNSEDLLREVTFKTILDTVLRQVGWAFWITPDYIEIVPLEYARTTKVFKVLPAEDLLVPIPNAINSLALAQNLQALGATFSIGGATTFGGQNGFQAQGFGGFGGNFNGGGNQNVGQGGQANQILGGGGLMNGLGLGAAGNQFGQVGGGFSFGGGNQNGTANIPPGTEIMILIQTVVDPGYWADDISNSAIARNLAAGGTNTNDPNDINRGFIQGDGNLAEVVRVEPKYLNRLIVSPLTRSIVVNGRSRNHRTTGVLPLTDRAPMMAGAGNNNPAGNAIVKNNPKPVDPVKVPAKGPAPKGDVVVSAPPRPAIKPGTVLDAERIWKQALEKGDRSPTTVIACADFLVNCREFKHAAELIKASLRTGITPERWYQDALAIALEESQGSQEDIERAYVSAVDLDATSPLAYMDVAQNLNRLNQPEAAARLCKVAAKLEPNVPDAYIHALACADNPKMEATYDISAFAGHGLLSRDWPSDRGELHTKARTHLMEMVKKLQAANKQADADKLNSLLEADKKRDLVIELMWAGKADLDLRVNEPIGSQCNSMHPLSVAGGSLKADLFDQKDDSRSEIYSAAEGYSGTYKIVVDKVWGSPLGNKATVKVTRHQGKPEESVEYHTIHLAKGNELTLNLENGRRRELAILPSPQDMVKYTAQTESNVQLMNKIRALIGGTGSVGLSKTTGMSGGLGSSSKSFTGEAITSGDKRLADMSWSTRLMTNKTVGVDIRAVTTIKSDGTSHVTAAPVFESVANQLKLKIDLIPGGE